MADPICEQCGGGATALYLHSRCHPTYPTWSFVQDSTLTIECALCRKPVVSLQLAEDQPCLTTGSGTGHN